MSQLDVLYDGKNLSMENTAKSNDGGNDLCVHRRSELVHGASTRRNDKPSNGLNCDSDWCDDWCFCRLAGA